MKKSLLLLCAIVPGLISCVEAPTYTVKGTLPDAGMDGKMIYLTRFDDNKNIDSTLVSGADFEFTGAATDPQLCVVTAMRRYYARFVLEAGDIALDFETHNPLPTTPLNTQFTEMQAEQDALIGEYRARLEAFEDKDNREAFNAFRESLYEDEYKEKIMSAYQKWFDRNNNNPVGVFVINEMRQHAEGEELEKVLAGAGEYVLAQERIQKIIKTNQALKETAEGKPFTDFTIEQEDGTRVSLSDYVGKGKYVLVDFWASWCGPCIAEVPVIKETYEKYKGKNFEVLGVAVWDKLEDTKAAVEKHALPWPQIMNAQTVPTDLYGVNGIPHIILFGPDGNIVARNLRGDGLKKAVADAMAK